MRLNRIFFALLLAGLSSLNVQAQDFSCYLDKYSLETGKTEETVELCAKFVLKDEVANGDERKRSVYSFNYCKDIRVHVSIGEKQSVIRLERTAPFISNTSLRAANLSGLPDRFTLHLDFEPSSTKSYASEKTLAYGIDCVKSDPAAAAVKN